MVLKVKTVTLKPSNSRMSDAKSGNPTNIFYLASLSTESTLLAVMRREGWRRRTEVAHSV